VRLGVAYALVNPRFAHAKDSAATDRALAACGRHPAPRPDSGWGFDLDRFAAADAVGFYRVGAVVCVILIQWSVEIH
jgi:hypothetical protein